MHAHHETFDDADRRVRTRRAAVVAALLTLLAGCSAAAEPLEVSAGDLTSSTATAVLVLEEREAGHLPTTTAETALDDAVRQVAAAGKTLAELSVDGEADAVRAELVTTCASLVLVLHDLTAALADGRSTRDAVRELETLLDDLEELERRPADA